VILSPAAGGITLDALIRSLLADQIKAWLDAHMPEIVEKLAREEIRRLTGRLP
jgi:cell pole-organizing protein PopZ